MVVEQIKIMIESIFDSGGFKQLERQVKKSREETNKLNEASKRISSTMGGSLKDVSKEVKMANNELKKFKFEWLSILFFGQAIMRVFGGILRASFQTWSAVTEGTSQAGGAMTQLQAAWEFFKYSLFDALLNSGLFQGFVDFVLRLVEWWSNLSDTTKTWIANLIVAGLVIGTLMMVFSTIALGLDGISLLLVGHTLQWDGILGLIKTSYTWISTKLIPAIWGMTVALASNPLTWFALLVAGIIVGIGYIYWMKKEVGGLGEIWKLFARGMFNILAGTIDSLTRTFGGFFIWFGEKIIESIKLTKTLLTAASSIPGSLGKMAKSALDELDKIDLNEVRGRFHLASKGLFFNSDEFITALRAFGFSNAEIVNSIAQIPKLSKIIANGGMMSLVDLGNVLNNLLFPLKNGMPDLDFKDYISDMISGVGNVFSGALEGLGIGGESGVLQVQVTNPEDIGKATANNLDTGTKQTTKTNAFSDELNRQGLGYLLTPQ